MACEKGISCPKVVVFRGFLEVCKGFLKQPSLSSSYL